MAFPPIIEPFFCNEENYDTLLILEAYNKFKNDFINNTTFFEEIKVSVEEKILDCSNCGSSCNNKFTCDNCPWKDKEDIFQHITSDKDTSLELTRDYRKKRKKRKQKLNERTPGLYNKYRTQRISWIKYIIENVGKDGIFPPYIQPDVNTKNKEKIKIYDPQSDFLIVLSRTTLEDGNKEIYINSSYNNPPYSFIKCFY